MPEMPRTWLRIRPARVEDSERIADILLGARAAFMPYAPSAHSEPEVREWVRTVLLPTGGVSVATAGEVLVGVVAVAIRDGIAWIEQLYVAPERVGQRIGTALLSDALGRLPARVRLHTFQPNLGSRRFYERHGFRVIALGDGRDNEERCPDVLYERGASGPQAGE